MKMHYTIFIRKSGSFRTQRNLIYYCGMCGYEVIAVLLWHDYAVASTYLTSRLIFNIHLYFFVIKVSISNYFTFAHENMV